MPGLYLDASSPDEALGRLPEAVREENRWLRRSGIALPAGHDEVSIEVAESIRIDTDVSRGAWRGLFQYELRPTSENDVEKTLERTALARAELMSYLEEGGASGQELDKRLRRHCAEELELLSRLGSRMRAKLPAETLERLMEVRQISVDRLNNLLPGDRERMAVFGGEKWTTRKVLRCFAVAERVLLRDVKDLMPMRAPGQSPR